MGSLSSLRSLSFCLSASCCTSSLCIEPNNKHTRLLTSTSLLNIGHFRHLMIYIWTLDMLQGAWINTIIDILRNQSKLYQLVVDMYWYDSISTVGSSLCLLLLHLFMMLFLCVYIGQHRIIKNPIPSVHLLSLPVSSQSLNHW